MDGRRPPPEMSNFYCLPGRAGGTPMVLVLHRNDRPTVDETCGIASRPSAERSAIVYGASKPAY